MTDSTKTSWKTLLPPILLAAAMAITAVVLWAAFLADLTDTPLPVPLPWWTIAALFYAAEAHVAHLHFGGDAHSFSVSEVALVLALFSLPPAAVVTAAIAGGAAAVVLRRRQRIVKVAFNVAHFALGATVASVVFTAILPSGSRVAGPRTWAAGLAAVLLVSLLGLLLIEAVIALSQRRLRPDLGRVIPLGLIAAAANTSVGLAAAVILSTQPAAAWMLLVPAAVLLLAYRAYLSEQQKRHSIEFLYGASEVLGRAGHVEEAVPALLAHTGRAFRAGLAELTIFPRHASDVALRAWWWPEGGSCGFSQLPANPAEMVAASLASDGGGLLMQRCSSRRDQPVRVAGRALNDAIVVAVEGDGGPIGSLLLANRLGDVTTFAPEEVRLLETLARQLGTALENGELERSLATLREGERELRHQALHDPLTGMPNRSLFADRLGHALSRRTTAAVALLFIDLDGFKDVNDTFGHSAGDEVLAMVASRVTDCLRPADTAARLGGDEFAVLIEGAGPAEAQAVAHRVLDAVRMPIELANGRVVAVDASIGVAMGAPGEVAPDALLRQADAEMYRAKARGKGAVEIAASAMGAVVAGGVR